MIAPAEFPFLEFSQSVAHPRDPSLSPGSMRFLEEVERQPVLSMPWCFFLFKITCNGGHPQQFRCSASHVRHAQELTYQVPESRNLDTIQSLLAHGTKISLDVVESLVRCRADVNAQNKAN